MVAADAVAPQGQLAERVPSVAVGEQRVVADGRGERPLGHAQHDDQVEVEACGERQRRDEHPLAEPPHAAEVGVELDLERAAEHVERGRTGDVVERRQPLEGGVDLLGGPHLVERPGGVGPGAAGEEGEQVAQPRHPDRPRRGTGPRVADGVDQPQDEVAQATHPFGLAAGMGRPSLVAVVVAALDALGHAVVLGRGAGEQRVPVGAPGDDAGGA